MKKIFESEFHGWNESCECVHVYELESEDDFWLFDEMTHEEKCEYFNVHDESGRAAPGTSYRTYDFELTTKHVIMFETFAINV